MSEPGTDEVDFEGVGLDRFHPVPKQLVEVGEDGTAVLVVDLRRK